MDFNYYLQTSFRSTIFIMSTKSSLSAMVYKSAIRKRYEFIDPVSFLQPDGRGLTASKSIFAKI